MITSYEWVVERLDEYGDIQEVEQYETRREAEENSEGATIGLCRRVHDTFDGNEVEREYAYLENGKLPNSFDGGSIVPKRF